MLKLLKKEFSKFTKSNSKRKKERANCSFLFSFIYELGTKLLLAKIDQEVAPFPLVKFLWYNVDVTNILIYKKVSKAKNVLTEYDNGNY